MQTEATTTPLAQLTRRLADRITTLVPDDDPVWAAPSPCSGWTAGDVLDHVRDTERDLLTRHGVELAALPDGDRLGRWRVHVDQVVDALSDPAVVARGFEGWFGPTTIGEAFGTFYTFDLVVHRWDLARALGSGTTFDDEELDLVERTLDQAGDAIHADGICGPAVPVPDGSSRQDRLLARTGRNPVE